MGRYFSGNGMRSCWVYNVPTLLKLRQEIGPDRGGESGSESSVLDGSGPVGDAIHHVHAKDTSMNKAAQDLTGRLETIDHGKVKDRSWSYVTLGYGHGELWWREFCSTLRLNGYDGWLSIEHEDIVLSRMEGMRRSVELLKRTMIEEPG